MTLLFDLDGVIFDTEGEYTRFWQQIGSEYFPEREDFATEIKGHSIEDILSREFASYPSDWKTIESRLYDMEQGMSFPFIPGAEEFLQLVCKQGLSRCLVTSSDKIKMQTVLKSRPEMAEYFPQMVIATDIERAKPAPDCYLLAAKKTSSSISQCIVFEDSMAGIQAGKDAKMKVVGLSTTNPAELLEGKVDMIIPDFLNISLDNLSQLLAK